MAFITIQKCPVCDSAAISKKLDAMDYTVSKEVFAILECSNCSLRFTQLVPEAGAAGAYYQSDNYISHTDTREGIVNKLYHFVRKRTLRRKWALLQHKTGITKGAVLDIGAGTGAFANTMKDAGWQVTGLEPDAATRQRASDLYGLDLQDTNVLNSIPAATCDAVTMWHVLEHVYELHAYINQIKKILKPAGIAFIAVPNYTSYDASVYQQYWAAYDVPRHLYHFSPASIEVLLKAHGLSLLEIKPMWFDSFYIAMLSQQLKNGKGNLMKAAWIGFVSNCITLFKPRRCSSLIYIIGKDTN